MDTYRLFWCRTSISRGTENQRIHCGNTNIPISIAQMPVPVPISRIRCASEGIGARFNFPPRLISVNLCMMSRRSLSFYNEGHSTHWPRSVIRVIYLVIRIDIACSYTLTMTVSGTYRRGHKDILPCLYAWYLRLFSI